jgi:hypothetical protein
MKATVYAAEFAMVVLLLSLSGHAQTGNLTLIAPDGKEYIVAKCEVDNLAAGTVKNCKLEPGYKLDDVVNNLMNAVNSCQQDEQKIIDASQSVVNDARELGKIAEFFHERYDSCQKKQLLMNKSSFHRVRKERP